MSTSRVPPAVVHKTWLLSSSLPVSLSEGHLYLWADLLWCGSVVVSFCKTPGAVKSFTCYRLSRPVRCCAGKSGDPDFACLPFPCDIPVIQKSLQTQGKWGVWGVHRTRLWSSAGPKLAEEPKRSAFHFRLTGLEAFPESAEHFFVFLPCTWMIWTDAPQVFLTIFNTHLSSASPASLHPHLHC